MEIDHLAITCASLDDGAAWAENRLGVVAGEMHHRRGESLSVGVGDDERNARINRGDGGIGGA